MLISLVCSVRGNKIQDKIFANKSGKFVLFLQSPDTNKQILQTQFFTNCHKDETLQPLIENLA